MWRDACRAPGRHARASSWVVLGGTDLQYRSIRRRFMASTVMSGALLGFAAPAMAAPAATDEVAEVVVTGTRIPSPNLESVSPVTAIGAQELRAQGVTRVEDMINTLPQALAAQGAALSNGSARPAT